jgi:hypothetical protein
MTPPRSKKGSSGLGVSRSAGNATRLAAAAGALAAVGTTAYMAVGRDRLVRWGATPAEVSAALPGDVFLPSPAIESTRARTVPGTPSGTWARLFPGTAVPAIGDRFAVPLPRFVPSLDALSLRTVAVAPGSHLVLATWDPVTEPAAVKVAAGAWVATWTLALRPDPSGGTRVLTRFRAAHPGQPDAPAMGILALEPAVFVVERRILGRLGRTVGA